MPSGSLTRRWHPPQRVVSIDSTFDPKRLARSGAHLGRTRRPSPRVYRSFEMRLDRRSTGALKWRMQSHMLACMQSTSVRIDVATHQEIKRLASDLGTSVGETVALAVRHLRQEQIGRELTAPLASQEVQWLDADLG